MVEPVIGFTITRNNDEPRAVIASDMSTIAYVGFAPDADEEAFPVGQGVLVRTSDMALRAKLGTTGTLADCLRGTAGQLGDFQAAMDIIVVRCEVAEDATIGEQLQALIGTAAEGDGLFALLRCGEELGKVPRLVGVPGYTHQMISGIRVGSISPGASGTNGTFDLGFTGGAGAGAAGTFTVAGGSLTAINITNTGNYTSPPSLSFAASANLIGAAAPVTLAPVGNPVIAAMPAILSQLLGHAVVEGPGTTETAIKTWRETFNSERLIPIDLWVKVLENGSIVTKPGTSRVLGLAARVDYEHGGAPMHSWANRPIQDIVGFLRNPHFSLTDGATEAQSLLAANIGVGVRGELGLESAIASSGFIFLGTDNGSDDPLWQFYNVTRGRDYIHLGLMRALRTYLGKFNIEAHVVQAILNTATIWFTDLQADGHILGFRLGFTENQNSPENLRLGRFAFYFKAEEPPVLRRLDIDSGRYRPALEGLVEDLLANTQPVTDSIAA